MRKLAIVLAVAAATLAAVTPAMAVSPRPTPKYGATYKVLQMNLCLSGMATCYARTAYRSIVDEATAQVANRDPAVVTLNEACSDDAAEIARRTGYHLRFAAVLNRGASLPCVEPGGRGVFGIAVLTKASIRTSNDEAFATQAGVEERRWICATTIRAITACTAHLSTRESTKARVANDAQCRELRGVLARSETAGTTVFGGDVNRRKPCAPATMWARADTTAGQKPGIQHIYGSTSLDDPSARLAAARHTDHDFFLTTGNLTGRFYAGQ